MADPELRKAADELLVRYGGDTFPTLFVSAKGATVVDDEGREILDFTSGQMCATIGHNHPAIVAAIKEEPFRGGTIDGSGGQAFLLVYAVHAGADEALAAYGAEKLDAMVANASSATTSAALWGGLAMGAVAVPLGVRLWRSS